MNTPKPVSADRRNAQLHPAFAWLNGLCAPADTDRDIDARMEAADQKQAVTAELNRMTRRAK